jgi:ParB family transcriptional regulator, chromosome partitioning protein
MERIETRLVSYDNRIRREDARRIPALAESIREVGLLNPITVYRTAILRNGQTVEGFGLIAGMHRLRACQSLGWTDIPAVILDLGDQQRIIAECDENLCVVELLASDRAVFTARRKEAYEALHPETTRGGDRKSNSQVASLIPSFAEDQSQKTGVSKQTVFRDAARGAKVTPTALALIRGTRLDTGTYLDTLKRMSPEKQLAKVHADLKPPRPAAEPARPPRLAPAPETDADVTERQVAALMAAWNRAGPEARRDFLARIETPIMDGAA